jgi:hypothetical protein
MHNFGEEREKEMKGVRGETPIEFILSGGLDLMILAALLDQCLSRRCKLKNLF